MDFYLGVSCWHVIGWENGDLFRAKLLCGVKPTHVPVQGCEYDVVMSDQPLCQSCDRATGGEAQRLVDAVVVNA